MIESADLSDVMSLVNPADIGLRVTAGLAGIFGIASTLGLVIPSVVERLMPPAVQDDLWTYLPLKRIREDLKTIECDGNFWIRMFEMRGADISLASDDKKEALYKARKYMVDELERYNVNQLKFFHCKERIVLERTLHADQAIVRAVGDRWEETFPTPYRLRHFAMVVVKAKNLEEAAGLLDPVENFMIAAMTEYGCAVMVEPDADEMSNDEFKRRAGPLEAMARIISPVSLPTPLGQRWVGPLGALISGDEIDFSRVAKNGTITFTAHGERKFGCIVTYRDSGEKTTEAVMRDVLAIDCPMIVYHAVRPIPNAKAIVTLNRGRLAALGEHLSFNAKDEYDAVLRAVEGQVSEERASLVYYTMHVLILADSEKELKQLYARLTAVMTRTAGTVVRLGPSAQPTLMSTVSFDSLWPRQFRYLSSNVATMLYPQRSQSGMTTSDWANEPIAWFRTVSGDPYPFSWHAHSGKNAPAHTLLIGPTGAGKAQPNHVLLQTPSGPVAMGDVRAGDMVYAEDGRAYPVVGVFPQGRKRRFRVTFSDGRSTECCDEHLWTVASADDPTRWETTTLAAVMARVGGDPGHAILIPVPEAMERDPVALDGSPYATGLGVAAAASAASAARRGRAARAAEGGVALDEPIVIGRDEAIPSSCLAGSVTQRVALLQGLMDSAGGVEDDGEAWFDAESEALAAQVASLVRGLGGTARVATARGRTRVAIRIAVPDRLFRSADHVATARAARRVAPRLAFAGFEELAPCEMTCIQVASPNALYVADDYVVTHNTSLLTFLASQSMRVPNLRTFLMDRLNGMKIFTIAAGGNYIAFNGDERNASLNPLHQPDTPENRNFLRLWIRLMTGVSDPQSDEEIGRAVSLIYSPGQSLANRKLSALQRVAFGATSDVRMALTPWINNEAYGTYFNADEDSLDLDSTRLAGFNMTDILTDQTLAPVMMHYLVHRFRDLSIRTTDPSLIIIDETAPMLQNEMFRNFLKSGLQEGRKLRQAYVLCFQTPKSLNDTGMSQVVLDQCGLLIFFRNPRDSDDAIAQYAQFGLNQSEIDFIVGRTFKDRRYAVLMKRPNANDSAIVDVDLSRLGPLMGVFESDARQVAQLDTLMQKMPPSQAVTSYINARR